VTLQDTVPARHFFLGGGGQSDPSLTLLNIQPEQEGKNRMALGNYDFQIASGHALVKSRHHLKIKAGPCPISKVLVPGVSLWTPW